MPSKLHLYVWPEVYCYYSYLTMFSLARDVEEARTLIRHELRDIDGDHCLEEHLRKEPTLVDQSLAFVVGGGAD